MAYSIYVNPEQEQRCRHIMVTTERNMRDIMREAMQVGLLVLLAGAPTDEHGQYANLTANDLVARLQPYTLHILELMQRQGRTPALLMHLPSPTVPVPAIAISPRAIAPSPTTDEHPRDRGVDGPQSTHDDDLLAELLDAGCMLVVD